MHIPIFWPEAARSLKLDIDDTEIRLLRLHLQQLTKQLCAVHYRWRMPPGAFDGFIVLPLEFKIAERFKSAQLQPLNHPFSVEMH
jgi:hypothetical protein